MKVRFKCPQCGIGRLQEVTTNVIEYTIVTGVTESDDIVAMEYGDVSHENYGDFDYYSCTHCDYELPPATSVELFDWLKENNMLEAE